MLGGVTLRSSVDEVYRELSFSSAHSIYLIRSHRSYFTVWRMCMFFCFFFTQQSRRSPKWFLANYLAKKSPCLHRARAHEVWGGVSSRSVPAVEQPGTRCMWEVSAPQRVCESNQCRCPSTNHTRRLNTMLLLASPKPHNFCEDIVSALITY